MSASHFPAMRATAMQVATALARYERHVRALAATWLDMELYAEVSQEIDEIKVCCAALPQLAVPWTALLVSHAEMIHALWQGAGSDAPATREETQRRLDEHLACIDALARRCVRLARSGEHRSG